MTDSTTDRRLTKLEIRSTELEEGYGESIYKLTRKVAAVKLVNGQLANGVNGLSRGMALMMERMGIPPIDLPEITLPTEAEIDAAVEDDD